jgi:hypothetical protein
VPIQSCKKSSQEVISPRWQKGKEIGGKACHGIKAMILHLAKEGPWVKERKKETVGASTLGQRALK